MIVKTVLFTTLLFNKVFSSAVTPIPATCQSCHVIDPQKINIHLIPHSHDDVGWLKTVEQYYYGNHKHIQNAGVQYIISSAINALKGHPDRRYIQVESAFFWKWWQNQEESMKELVRELVNAGQLEIVNGAWSMNDEAASNYQSIIDQFTLGFRFLNESIGECARPKIGWQIDPFGHSREHASLLSQFGFEGLVIGRLDYRDKQTRRNEKRLDFIWESSVNLPNSEMFTTMFPDFYISIPGFCFDLLCSDEAINDNPNSPEYNLDMRIRNFISYMEEFKVYYNTSHILVPMGGDFTYQAAEINFSNLDKLIKGLKNHTTYNVIYSTPSCYIKAVNDEVNARSLNLTRKTDDFFPYASEAHGFWTGYFTSRPTSKRFERFGNNLLQAVKQLSSFSRIKRKDFENSIAALKNIMGIMQHHDAITGTEKDAVAKDYARLMTDAIKEAEKPIGIIIGDLVKNNLKIEIDLKLQSCLLSNVSVCEATKQDNFFVVVYNPLSHPVDHFVQLPVSQSNVQIMGPSGIEEYDIFEPISNFSYITEFEEPHPLNLIFKVSELPPFGVKIYKVERISEDKVENLYTELVSSTFFGTESNGFTIDGETKLLSSVTINKVTLNVTQNFYYYLGTGYSGRSVRASGAYVFTPKQQNAEVINPERPYVKFKKGKLVDEVLQIFSPEISQIIRIYKSGNCIIEFDWLVGDLKLDHDAGKEIITRYTVDNFSNKGIFYTDSNGREQMQRELNKRKDYNYSASEEPISSNYYPITSKIVINDQDKNLEVAILTDRAEGGTSLKYGELELMIHRRSMRDDGLGVGEPLRENEYGKGLFVRGQHWLHFGTIKPSWENELSSAATERILAQRRLMAPLVWINTEEIKDLDSLIRFEFSGLRKLLPENVKILTLEPWLDDSYLLRLEHILEKEEDSLLSEPVTVDLEELFTEFFISEIGETTLGANQWLDDYQFEEKLNWNNISSFTPLEMLNPSDPLKIVLGPMQIRTFIVKVKSRFM